MITTTQPRGSATRGLSGWPQDGYFMALAKQHNFLPGFESQWTAGRAPQDALAKIELRERCAAQSIGWGAGTLTQAGTPIANRRPELVKGGRA